MTKKALKMSFEVKDLVIFVKLMIMKLSLISHFNNKPCNFRLNVMEGDRFI